MLLAQRIQAFTTQLMQEASQIDQTSGQRYINVEGEDFTRKMQMERDRFEMDTGYSVEQVNRFLQGEQLRREYEKEDAVKQAQT